VEKKNTLKSHFPDYICTGYFQTFQDFKQKAFSRVEEELSAKSLQYIYIEIGVFLHPHPDWKA
jgi:hypothetical protein